MRVLRMLYSLAKYSFTFRYRLHLFLIQSFVLQLGTSICTPNFCITPRSY
jgi:hypothetical protein